MNQKELAELKKNYSKENGMFTINRIASYYINSDKEIVYHDVKEERIIDQSTFDYLNMYLMSTLKGRIGKGNKEYTFINESKRDLFHNLVLSRLCEKDILEEFVQNIIDNYDYISNYAIFIAHYTYSVLKKGNDVLDDRNDDSSEEYNYNFIITSICPIETINDGFVYNGESFICDSELKNIVQLPVNGMLYPAFSDRCADISSVLVYEKTPNKPNKSIVENVCEAEFTFSIKQQKESFNDMLNSVIGDKMNYNLATDINAALIEKFDMQKLNTDPAVLTKEEVIQILIEAGVDPDNRDYLDKYYDKTFNDAKLDTFALIDTKNKVQTGNFTITFSNDATSELKTQIVNGKNCIVIPIDEAIDINGITVRH